MIPGMCFRARPGVNSSLPSSTQAALQWEHRGESAEKLTVRLVPDESDMKKATLEILWGKEKLSAPIGLEL